MQISQEETYKNPFEREKQVDCALRERRGSFVGRILWRFCCARVCVCARARVKAKEKAHTHTITHTRAQGEREREREKTEPANTTTR